MLKKNNKIQELLDHVKEKYAQIGIRREEQYYGMIDSINSAYENGELIKKELKDITDSFGYLWDMVSDRANKGSLKSFAPIYENEMSPLHEALEAVPYNRTGFNKYCRNIKKCKDDGESPEMLEKRDEILKWMDAMIDISEKIAGLKGLVVTKKKDTVQKAEAAEKEQARKASHKDVVTTVNFLKDLTSGKREKLVKQFKAHYLRNVEAKINKLKESGMEIPMNRAREKELGYKYSDVSIVLSGRENFSYDHGSRKTFAKFKEPKEIEKEALKFGNEIADQLIDQYVYRIADKVSFIIAGKNNLESVSSDEFKVSSAIEGKLSFKFKDGTGFSLNTSTVMSQNPVNPGFHIKVPTRFVDITDESGELKRSMSEKEVQDHLVPGV